MRERARPPAYGSAIFGPDENVPDPAFKTNVLDLAARAVNGARAEHYGHPAEHAERVAGMWAACFGWDVTPERVEIAMALFKIARLAHDRAHRDSLVDVAGYARAYEAVLAREGVDGFEDLTRYQEEEGGSGGAG